MNQPHFTPGPWSLDYVQGDPATFRITAGDHSIVELSSQEHAEEATANAHLIAAAPMLYEALKELLLSTEEALIVNQIGCECDRCDKAKQASYRAIGFAEVRTTLKEENFHKHA